MALAEPDPTTFLTEDERIHVRDVLHSVEAGEIPNDTRRGPFAAWRDTMRPDNSGFERTRAGGKVNSRRAPLLACEALEAAETARDLGNAALSLAKLARSVEGDVGGRGDGIGALATGRWALAGRVDEDPTDLAAVVAIGLLALASIRLSDL